MKKILLSLFSLMLMIAGNVSAQEVTIDFSGSTDNWGIGTTKLIDATNFTYGGYTITLEGTAGNGYRWYDSGNIILGKQGATLTLPAFSFDVERIDVVGTSSASAAVKQNIFVGDDAVSTETTGAKDVTNQYAIAEGKQAAGTIYTLKVTSAHNTQITKILVWKKGTTVVEEIPVVENIAAFNALEKGTKATLTLTEAQVIGVGNNNIIVKDASGSVCMYNTGLEYTLGQILNGTITGTVGEFKSYKQLTSMTENDLTATEGTITPTVVTAADAAAAALLSGPYKIESAVVKKDGSNFYIMDGEEKVLQLYNQFKDANITLAEGTFDIEGVVGNYNNVQFWVTSFTKLPEELEVVEVEASCYVNENYLPGGNHDVTIDWDAIATALGCTSDALKIYAVLPDGTLDESYERGSMGTDGWRDAQGNWAGWNSADNIFYVQFSGLTLAGIGCMRTAEPIAYTAIFKVVDSANEDGDFVTLKVTLNVTEAPVVELTYEQLDIVGKSAVEVYSKIGESYEGMTENADVNLIITTLGIQSLDDVTIYAVKSDGTLDMNYGLGSTDGWRNAAGDWSSWGNSATAFCVKADFTAETAFSYIGGYGEGAHLTEPVTYQAKYVFVAAEDKAFEFVLNMAYLTEEDYNIATAINSVAATKKAAAIYNAAGQLLSAPQKGLNIIDGKKVFVK